VSDQPPPFPVHDLASAPPDAAEVLRQAKQKYGTLPNLEGAMAEAPALPEAYETGSELFAETTFSAVEREVVAMTVNAEHGCTPHRSMIRSPLTDH
jgi:alkylhydroperoxidase family enzyme